MIKTTNFFNDVIRFFSWFRKKEFKTDGRIGNFFKKIYKGMKK